MSLIKALPLVQVLPVLFIKRFQYRFHFHFRKVFIAVHMDTFSGSCLQKFISFCLGMSSKKALPESTVPTINNFNEDNPEHVGSASTTDPPRPSSQTSNCSRSTDESVTAFIERTVTEKSLPEPESASILSAQQGAVPRMSTMDFAFQKVLVSETIVITPSQPISPTGPNDKEETASQEEAAPLYGDTTDAEELLDSSGVAAFPPVSRSVTLNPEDFPDLEGEFH